MEVGKESEVPWGQSPAHQWLWVKVRGEGWKQENV